MAILTWRSKRTTLKDVRALELDTSATQLPAPNGRLGTGLVECGSLKNPYEPPKTYTKKSAERHYHFDNREGTDWSGFFFVVIILFIVLFHHVLIDFFVDVFKEALYGV